MERKTFLQSLGVGAVGGAVASPGEIAASEGEAMSGIAIGPEDTVIIRVAPEARLDDYDGLKAKIRETMGCKEVILTQGIEGIHVVGPR